MNTKAAGLIVGAIVVLAIGAVLWVGGGQSPEPEQAAMQTPVSLTQPVPSDASAVPAQTPPQTSYPKSDISLEAYFAEFGGIAAMDLKAKKIRPDVEAKIREQLVGTQVTWEGYVKKIAEAASGGVTLVLAETDGPVGLESAMIRFSAELHDQLEAYQQGDHVRVVAVFDDLMTVFPLLRGQSVESISES